MVIGIIGGSGFIGTILTKRLLNRGYNVKIIDKKRSRYFPEFWVNADVRDFPSLVNSLKGCEVIYNLAAEHRDCVKPRSLYWEVNVKGAENVCSAAEKLGIKKIIFTSSVAVYGLPKRKLKNTLCVDESLEPEPFNDYGITKLKAEEIYKKWQKRGNDRTLVIVRPTVVFGEGNRGNIYKLFKLIESGKFIMVGNGKNVRSIAYVENVAAFLEFALKFKEGLYLFNYSDKPDYDMETFIQLVYQKLGKKYKRSLRLPFFPVYVATVIFNRLSSLIGYVPPITPIKVKKFCSNACYSTSVGEVGFVPPVSLEEGIERTIKFEFLER